MIARVANKWVKDRYLVFSMSVRYGDVASVRHMSVCLSVNSSQPDESKVARFIFYSAHYRTEHISH